MFVMPDLQQENSADVIVGHRPGDNSGGHIMKLFKRITALALAAVIAGALGLGAAAQPVVDMETAETTGIGSGA